MIGEYVLVRNRSAGVHHGYLVEWFGTVVKLREARRLWKWSGAFTLNEIAVHGCDEQSRISEAVPLIGLTEATEVIPCSEKARMNLQRSRNGA